jgi:O-antigen ligase
LLIQIFLLWVYVVATTRTRQDVLLIVTLLITALALESLSMIAVGVTGRSFDLGVITVGDERGRVAGTFGSPNVAAGFLYLLLAPALSILLTRSGRYYKWLAILGFGLGSLALLLTFSRAGWFAFFLSCGLLCFLAWRYGWLSPLLPLLFVIVVLLLAVIFQDSISNRIFGDDNGSAAARGPLMQLAFNMIWDNPLGVGANNFAVRLMQYATLDRAAVWLFTVHNKYLLVWAEAGIGALVAFLWFLLTIIRRGWYCWRARDRFLSPLALAFTLSIIGHMLHMSVDIFNSRTTVQLLWLIAALITAMYSIAREETQTAFQENL